MLHVKPSAQTHTAALYCGSHCHPAPRSFNTASSVAAGRSLGRSAAPDNRTKTSAVHSRGAPFTTLLQRSRRAPPGPRLPTCCCRRPHSMDSKRVLTAQEPNRIPRARRSKSASHRGCKGARADEASTEACVPKATGVGVGVGAERYAEGNASRRPSQKARTKKHVYRRLNKRRPINVRTMRLRH